MKRRSRKNNLHPVDQFVLGCNVYITDGEGTVLMVEYEGKNKDGTYHVRVTARYGMSLLGAIQALSVARNVMQARLSRELQAGGQWVAQENAPEPEQFELPDTEALAREGNDDDIPF
jgi:hypothetical protein